MLYPIIKVKDCNGHEHIVGEDIHDTLYIDEKGALQYLNAHCCAGTGYPEEGYTFVGTDGDDEGSLTGRPEVEFVTLDRLVEIEAERFTKKMEVLRKLNGIIDKNTKELLAKSEVHTQPAEE